jgi:transcriptional regulator with XRE-family HTH domain
MRTTGKESSRSWTVRSADDLGRAIAGVRAERGLTQAQLADQTGLDRTYLARLEAGATALVLERALRALRRMGATVTVELEDPDGAPR